VAAAVAVASRDVGGGANMKPAAVFGGACELVSSQK